MRAIQLKTAPLDLVTEAIPADIRRSRDIGCNAMFIDGFLGLQPLEMVLSGCYITQERPPQNATA